MRFLDFKLSCIAFQKSEHMRERSGLLVYNNNHHNNDVDADNNAPLVS